MSLDVPIYTLLKTEPFFAHFLLSCTVKYDDTLKYIAGVGVQKNNVVLVINPNKYEALLAQGKVAVLKHETLHVVLKHMFTKNNNKYANDMELRNIAMDCAINQYIQGLPDGSITLESLSQMLGEKLEAFQSWEYYYNKIVSSPNVQTVKASAPAHGDMDSDEELSECQQIAIDDMINKAAKASKGNLPQIVINNLGQQRAPSELNWKRRLRNLVTRARSVNREPTRRRSNRRYELEQPGYKKQPGLTLGVCVDSSGSVSNEAYASFMSEICHIAKATTKTYVIHADCVVQKIEEIKGGRPKGSQLQDRHGAGGTAYQPAITACMDRQCDAIIYFGDMDSADKPLDPKVPFIWVRVGTQPPPADFGTVLTLEKAE